MARQKKSSGDFFAVTQDFKSSLRAVSRFSQTLPFFLSTQKA
jgi:hypothetical protein